MFINTWFWKQYVCVSCKFVLSRWYYSLMFSSLSRWSTQLENTHWMFSVIVLYLSLWLSVFLPIAFLLLLFITFIQLCFYSGMSNCLEIVVPYLNLNNARYVIFCHVSMYTRTFGNLFIFSEYFAWSFSVSRVTNQNASITQSTYSYRLFCFFIACPEIYPKILNYRYI